jgi:transposase-like protein
VIRKAIKKRKLLPNDDAAKKVIYLAISDALKNGPCRFAIGNWHSIASCQNLNIALAITFEVADTQNYLQG